MTKFNFIKTSDEETKDTLLKEGYKLISKDGSIYTFINDAKLSFDNNKLKVKYSNLLTL